MDGIKCDEVHLFYVGLAVGSEVFLVGENLDNVGDKVDSGG